MEQNKSSNSEADANIAIGEPLAENNARGDEADFEIVSPVASEIKAEGVSEASVNLAVETSYVDISTPSSNVSIAETVGDAADENNEKTDAVVVAEVISADRVDVSEMTQLTETIYLPVDVSHINP